MVFMLTVVVLTFISLLSVWGFVGEDAVLKSIYTIMVVAIASVIVVVVAESVGDKSKEVNNINNNNSNLQ